MFTVNGSGRGSAPLFQDFTSSLIVAASAENKADTIITTKAYHGLPPPTSFGRRKNVFSQSPKTRASFFISGLIRGLISAGAYAEAVPAGIEPADTGLADTGLAYANGVSH